MPQAAKPVIPIIPSAAARPPLADELIAATPMQDFDLARDLTLFARVLRRAEGRAARGGDLRYLDRRHHCQHVRAGAT